MKHALHAEHHSRRSIMTNYKEILRMYCGGYSQRAIASSLKCSRDEYLIWFRLSPSKNYCDSYCLILVRCFGKEVCLETVKFGGGEYEDTAAIIIALKNEEF